MKGFVLTIDGIIALIVFISLFVIISSPTLRTTSSAWSDVQVRRLSMDSLTILEKNGALGRAVESNSSSELIYFMGSEFTSLCMQITVSEGDSHVLSAVKSGCVEGRGAFITRRSFVSGDDFYTAELHAWSR
ncbi:MAG: hypothetical protein Sv326_0584 [Candidatus Fermentimicrarchaeum limneticum]|uniref:Uncharacterized protein n=1 Tax=Fermentimicrarchaeum limneticum TaxID=2795018 RepID=A0A7D6BC23_FERL1|nr:MAG: hypothetical protein Sv326_0584 [Candidatus Fermentimicrarchaeum limneticum]